MSTGRGELNGMVQRATARLAQLQARQALHELRESTRARAQARAAARQRAQRVADTIEAAGLDEWTPEEVTGLLLAARDHFGTSDTARALARERAAQGVPPRSPH